MVNSPTFVGPPDGFVLTRNSDVTRLGKRCRRYNPESCRQLAKGPDRI